MSLLIANPNTNTNKTITDVSIDPERLVND